MFSFPEAFGILVNLRGWDAICGNVRGCLERVDTVRKVMFGQMDLEVVVEEGEREN